MSSYKSSSRHSGNCPRSADAGDGARAASREWNGKLIDQAPFKRLRTFLGCYAPTKRRFWGDGGPERDGINTAFTVMSQCGAMRGLQGRLRDDDDRTHTRC